MRGVFHELGNIRDMNESTANHPFGDIYAERNGERYLLGVRTRNKYQVSGLLNPTYNIKKRGADVSKLAELHRAHLAWVAIQVIPERQVVSAFFSTIRDIEEGGKRFSIPMREFDTRKYECLAKEEIDTSLRVEWSNGGYARSRDRRM
jgi:hypothetical protein